MNINGNVLVNKVSVAGFFFLIENDLYQCFHAPKCEWMIINTDGGVYQNHYPEALR